MRSKRLNERAGLTGKAPGTLDIKHTSVFKRNWLALNDTKIRFVINQGGTRSSKTYSICQLILVYCLTNPLKNVSIVRKSFPSLSASVMKDFIEILQEHELYMSIIRHNKTTNTFVFPNGTVVKFFSIDDEQKIRGRKQSLVFINEANELSQEEFLQLNLRTTEKIFIDFNPSDTESWIYNLLSDEKAIKIHSTYKDNKFLSQEQVREIENLINIDESYYQIYTLGIIPNAREKVFMNFEYQQFPNDIEFVYGLDFGYKDPCALVKVGRVDDKLYIQQLLYETHLNPEQLIERLNQLNIDQNIPIFSDSARPDLIDLITQAGFYATKSDKAINKGLDTMRTFKIFLDNSSQDLIKEFNNYSYKKVRGKIVDGNPVDAFNHAIDAARYATLGLQNSTGFGISIMI